MPLKPGGGNHMQLYDPKSGEYTDQEKQRMREYDSFAIVSYKWNRNTSYKFHFPIEGVHEENYCRDFVQCIRFDIREPIYNQSKMDYLLSFKEKNDKSRFLESLGYSKDRPNKLFYDICANTKRSTFEFSRFSHGELIVEAQTILQGKLIKTIWKIEKNLDIAFVTLIPGGDKLWKK